MPFGNLFGDVSYEQSIFEVREGLLPVSQLIECLLKLGHSASILSNIGRLRYSLHQSAFINELMTYKLLVTATIPYVGQWHTSVQKRRFIETPVQWFK